jgi:hypothetical protein
LIIFGLIDCDKLKVQGVEILPQMLLALQAPDLRGKSAATEAVGTLGPETAPAIPLLVAMLEGALFKQPLMVNIQPGEAVLPMTILQRAIAIKNNILKSRFDEKSTS